MCSSATFPFFWRVCLINGAAFWCGDHPANHAPKVSDETTALDFAVQILGLVAVMVIDTIQLRGTLAHPWIPARPRSA